MGSGFRTFQSGEVLTSSNVQNYLMDQAVTVFAGTASRGSAIASPETGMVSYRTDGTADSKREGFEFYDGSAWTRLIPAATSSALVLVKTQTIGSGVTSVQVTSAFSSTYDNYKIMIVGGTATSVGNMTLQLGATTTGYYASANRVTWAGVHSVNGSSNAANWFIVGGQQTGVINADITIMGPNLAKQTVYHAHSWDQSTTGVYGPVGGWLNNTTQYTDFTIAGATMTGGEIRVYGFQNS